MGPRGYPSAGSLHRFRIPSGVWGEGERVEERIGRDSILVGGEYLRRLLDTERLSRLHVGESH